MRHILLLFGLLAMVLAVPTVASALPRPTEIEVIDAPNDDGSSLGVLWRWEGAVTDDTVVIIEVEIPGDLTQAYLLKPEEMAKLTAAREALREALGPILPEMYAAKAKTDDAQERFKLAEANRSQNLRELRLEYHRENADHESLIHQRDRQWRRFNSRVNSGLRSLFPGKVPYNLYERNRIAAYLQATLADEPWVEANISSFMTKGDAPARFGHEPPEADKNYVEVNGFRISNPGVLDGTYTEEPDELDETAPPTITMNFDVNRQYALRMVVTDGVEREVYDLSSATTKTGLFNTSKFNNFIFAIIFGLIIMVAIMLARRNPNLFIRRIAGLEAVDEAIGRATEMGKPVLYLCGLDSLATLATLAAVNILGRVARRIADYDSDLIVPNRDPVVLTVAQEVVREAYIEQGRPDAYKEDNIFFVTDDQFSFTATTCAIMMREKPAANFFMGYYYAESLLLAETGAATGAIQIAGTDALHQLPFFITTCDYTLIGEELYAASAYLSREPMLLGSLKGQDVGKAFIMLLIIIQTLLFVVAAILEATGVTSGVDWGWLTMLVEPI